MKKTLSLTAILSLVLTLTFPTGGMALAAQTDKNNPKSISHHAEIRDLKTLFERAKHGVSDDKRIVTKGLIKNEKTGDTLQAGVFNTTQLLDEVIDNGVETRTYRSTSFIVSTDPTDANKTSSTKNALQSSYSSNGVTTSIYNLQLLTGGGGYEQYTWDNSGGVKAYCTSYYTTQTTNGVDTIKFTSASGGWSVSDSSISVSRRSVILGYGGSSTANQYVGNKEYKYPTSNTFNYSVNFPYLRTNTAYNIGTETNAYLTRGSSVWSVYLNDIYKRN